MPQSNEHITIDADPDRVWAYAARVVPIASGRRGPRGPLACHVGGGVEPARGGDAAELQSTFSQIYRDGLESVRSRVEGG